MDAKTIEAMSALGVDITPEAPTQVPSAEDAAKAAEAIKAKIADEDGIKIEPKEPNDKPEPTDEPKAELDSEGNPVKKVVEDPTIGNDEGKKPESKPEDKEPKISNDENPDLKTEVHDDPRQEGIKPEDDLDEILKTLESLTEESLEGSKETTASTKTEEKIKEKIEEAKKQEGDPKKQSKTIQEIVDLNVKLQQELAVANTVTKASKNKLSEVQEELSAIKMDDTRVVVPVELQGVNKYLKKFKETSNETFKIKAVQGAIDLIEDLTGKPLKGYYVDDFIEDSLKSIETTTKKQAAEIAHDKSKSDDPRIAWAETHGVSV